MLFSSAALDALRTLLALAAYEYRFNRRFERDKMVERLASVADCPSASEGGQRAMVLSAALGEYGAGSFEAARFKRPGCGFSHARLSRPAGSIHVWRYNGRYGGTMAGILATVSQQSFDCVRAVGSARHDSSRDLGWSSLLLDRHWIRGSGDYQSLPTPDQTIVLAHAGRSTFDVREGGRWHHLVRQPGSISLRRGGDVTRASYSADGDDGTAEMMLLYLPHLLLEATSEHLRRVAQRTVETGFNVMVEKDPAIAQVLVALDGAMRRRADNLYAESVATWLSVHLFSCHGASASIEDHRRPGVLTDKRLARVIDLITSRFHEPLSLDELASTACISKYHFVRLFRAETGKTPHAYINDLRLHAACHMLKTSERPVADIGLRCGFPLPANFSAAFKSKFGIAPRAFRHATRM